MATNNKQKSYFVFVCAYAVGIILLNLCMSTNYADDEVNRTLMDEFHNVFDWVSYRYQNWSSRFLQEGTGYFLLNMPMLWRLFNAIGMFFAPMLISYLLELHDNQRYLAYAFFLMYPIIDQREAGWICTTITYFWPAIIGLAVCCLIKKYYKSEHFSWYWSVLFYLALLIASNHELLAVYLLCIMLYCLIYKRKEKKGILVILIGGVILSICNIIIIMMSPGIRNRSASETATWFPEYADFSMIDKLYLGIVRCVKVFVTDKDLLFLLLCVLIAVGAWKSKSIIKCCCGVLPIMIVTSLHYMISSINPGDITEINWNSLWTYFWPFLAIVMLAGLTMGMIEIFKDDKFRMGINLVVLYIGLATVVAMGFSPTIYASGVRTMTFCHFGIIYLCVDLMKKFIEKWSGRNDTLQGVFVSWMVVGVIYLSDLLIILKQY